MEKDHMEISDRRLEAEEKERQAKAAADLHRSEGRVKIDTAFVHGAADGWIQPGNGQTEWFKDMDAGPEMVVVRAGKFVMGSPKDEPGPEGLQLGAESPQREVTLAKPFAVGRCAVTFGEWDAYIADTGSEAHKPQDQGWGRGRQPVVNVSWDDAQAYISWLSDKTKQSYRLLTEAEWEYVARAGTNTPFWWGKSITPEQANYNGNYVYEGGGSEGQIRKKTVPVDNLEANPWGLYNVHGNIWEWCEDIWHDSYNGAPSDGSSWLQDGETSRRVVRGGSWGGNPGGLRSAFRNWFSTDYRNYKIGFRLARTLNP